MMSIRPLFRPSAARDSLESLERLLDLPGDRPAAYSGAGYRLNVGAHLQLVFHRLAFELVQERRLQRLAAQARGFLVRDVGNRYDLAVRAYPDRVIHDAAEPP